MPKTKDPEQDTKKVSIRPGGYWVVVELINLEQTKGGILLKERERHQQRWARVVAKGQGDFIMGQYVPIPYDKGDVVCLEPNRGFEITIKQKKLLVINYREIFFSVRTEDGEVMSDEIGFLE